jgi:hypothetical protein
MIMRSWLRIVPLLVMLGVLTTPIAGAESKAVQTMAGILANLNHFPTDTEKAALKQIIDDKTTTAQERVVAQALLNVQHKANADDKAKLEALAKDKDAPESVKTLASVIANLNHTPSAADKEKLKKLSAEQ